MQASRIPTFVAAVFSGLLKLVFSIDSSGVESQLLPRWILKPGWLASSVHSDTFPWQSNRPLGVGGLRAGGCGAVASGVNQL